jgi:nitrogenase molybdenum-iron protein alpha/beta subunit
MNSAARGIKKVILRIGQYVIGPIVEDLFIWNMLYDPDESIKGDVQVVPSGVISMIMKEQTAAQRERFLQTTNNSTDLQLMGLDGRAVVLREQAKELDIPVEKVVKTPEEVQAIENQLKQMAEAVQAQAAGGNMGSRSVRVA